MTCYDVMLAHHEALRCLGFVSDVIYSSFNAGKPQIVLLDQGKRFHLDALNIQGKDIEAFTDSRDEFVKKWTVAANDWNSGSQDPDRMKKNLALYRGLYSEDEFAALALALVLKGFFIPRAQS